MGECLGPPLQHQGGQGHQPQAVPLALEEKEHPQDQSALLCQSAPLQGWLKVHQENVRSFAEGVQAPGQDPLGA